jgi:hypothetical protein
MKWRLSARAFENQVECRGRRRDATRAKGSQSRQLFMLT